MDTSGRLSRGIDEDIEGYCFSYFGFLVISKAVGGGLLWCVSVKGSYFGDSEVLGEALVGGVVE